MGYGEWSPFGLNRFVFLLLALPLRGAIGGDGKEEQPSCAASLAYSVQSPPGTAITQSLTA